MYIQSVTSQNVIFMDVGILETKLKNINDMK